MTTTITTIPSKLVRTYLHAARTPLTVTERVLGHAGDEEWAPSLAFSGFEANVLQVAGGVLRDESLGREGALLAAKVQRLREAATLDTIAEQRRAEADDELERRRAQAEQRRDDAAARAEQAKQAAERVAQRQAEQRAREEQQQAERDAAAQRKAAAKRERTAKAATLRTERAALAAERAAAAVEEQVVDTDAAIERSKRVRKAR